MHAKIKRWNQHTVPQHSRFRSTLKKTPPYLSFSAWEEKEKIYLTSYQVHKQILAHLNINQRSVQVTNMPANEVTVTIFRDKHVTLTSYLKCHREWFFYPSLWLQITIHWQEKNRCLKLELYVYCQSYGRHSDYSHPIELLLRYPKHCPVVIS